MFRPVSTGGVYVTGLAHAYPQYAFGNNEFSDLIARLYPHHSTSPGLQKLLRFSSKTKIDSRRAITDSSNLTHADATPPTIDELSRIFRTDGVALATSASHQAMMEAGVSRADITHLVAVTCTDQGSPGYDLLVSEKLQLLPDVQRTLLHGVGCAGGLSALRTAANLAAAELQRNRPACILVVACEICTIFLRAELKAASCDESLHIAPALFSDAAAALVVCNGLALDKNTMPIYEMEDWSSMVVPGTKESLSYTITNNGMIASMTKDVPKIAIRAITPMFEKLCGSATISDNRQSQHMPRTPSESDWAIHPGGAAILEGAQQTLHLTDDHIRASLKVYKDYGNSSSASVLIVLDKMRTMGRGRDTVVATSFGPGMMIEMCLMKSGKIFCMS
ncbi:thiolase-like protein [Ampelomyces quisqualis]|uniref:Thiolase-like protein n=1 Tax=Ampelomyces quisqualis TaxID=50730 RepID=A0A6A5QT49_AMPQU|nr:thiolase-like protein [Ampelomyces quisqualis]